MQFAGYNLWVPLEVGDIIKGDKYPYDFAKWEIIKENEI